MVIKVAMNGDNSEEQFPEDSGPDLKKTSQDAAKSSKASEEEIKSYLNAVAMGQVEPKNFAHETPKPKEEPTPEGQPSEPQGQPSEAELGPDNAASGVNLADFGLVPEQLGNTNNGADDFDDLEPDSFFDVDVLGLQRGEEQPSNNPNNDTNNPNQGQQQNQAVQGGRPSMNLGIGSAVKAVGSGVSKGASKVGNLIANKNRLKEHAQIKQLGEFEKTIHRAERAAGRAAKASNITFHDPNWSSKIGISGFDSQKWQGFLDKHNLHRGQNDDPSKALAFIKEKQLQYEKVPANELDDDGKEFLKDMKDMGLNKSSITKIQSVAYPDLIDKTLMADMHQFAMQNNMSFDKAIEKVHNSDKSSQPEAHKLKSRLDTELVNNGNAQEQMQNATRAMNEYKEALGDVVSKSKVLADNKSISEDTLSEVSRMANAQNKSIDKKAKNVPFKEENEDTFSEMAKKINENFQSALDAIKQVLSNIAGLFTGRKP